MTDEELHASLIGSARLERDASVAAGLAISAGVTAYRAGLAREPNPLAGGALGPRWARGWDIARAASQARMDRDMRRAARMADRAAASRMPYSDT